MSAFTSRTTVYKAGVGLLFVLTAVCIAGFTSPYWASARSDSQRAFGRTVSYSYHEGLWMLCITADVQMPFSTGCSIYGIFELPFWFHVVRAMTWTCLSGLVIACLYTLATNCCRIFPGPLTRVVEIIVALSGTAGFVGCMMYVGLTLVKTSDPSLSVNQYIATLLLGVHRHLDWALYLAAIGSGLSVIAAIIIAVGNKPVEGEAHNAGAIISTITFQPMYSPQPVVGATKSGVPPQLYVGGSAPVAALQPYVGGPSPGNSAPPYVVQPGCTSEKAGHLAPY